MMTLPTIHMNGTSKESLIDDLCEASLAINAAYEALKRTAPNGRDYYPQGPDAINHAMEEHMHRLSVLDVLKSDIDRLIIAIDEGGHKCN